jgi:hypothetical protein
MNSELPDLASEATSGRTHERYLERARCGRWRRSLASYAAAIDSGATADGNITIAASTSAGARGR